MALIVITQSGKVEQIMPSVDESRYVSRNDVLVNPVLPSCEQRYMVVENGSVREQTAQEKQADVDAAAAVQAAYDAKVKAYTDALKSKWDGIGPAVTSLQNSVNTFPASPTTAQFRSGLLTVAQNLIDLAKLIQDTRPMLEEFYKDWAGRQP